MKPQSIILTIALLTACALAYGQTMPPGTAQDYEAMAKAMEKAQAQANQPGDERLTCDQLQQQLVAVAQDPAFQAYAQAAGVQAQKQLEQMQAAQGQIAAKSAATAVASMPPGAAMNMAQGQQMLAFMPKLMRGQRLLELGVARKCVWATGIVTGVSPIPNR